MYFIHQIKHFGTQLTPLCKLILKYEATYKTPYRNPIIAYFIISAITTVGFEAINKKISYIEELPWKSYFGKYGNNLSYAANPVIFCGIFKVPLVSGIIMGMISKGLQDNIFDRYRELISD